MALHSALERSDQSLMQVDHKAFYELDQLTLEHLKPYRAILLTNVPSLSQYSKFMLEQYLAEGVDC